MPLNPDDLDDVAQSVRDLFIELDARVEAIQAGPGKEVQVAMFALAAVLYPKIMNSTDADSLTKIAELQTVIEGWTP